MHLTQVLSPQGSKQTKIDQWTNKNEVDYNRSQEEKLQREYVRRINDSQITGNTLNWQIGEKKMKKNLEVEMQRKAVDERH